MKRLVHAELYKLRTTSAWWLFTLAVLASTLTMLVVNAVSAYSLLKPFSHYVTLQTHGHEQVGTVDAGFLAHLQDEWTAGHSLATQAATLYTSGQLIGVLLACLLGIVLVTSEFHQQTATATLLQTPARRSVVGAKLVAALLVGAGAWLLTTVVSVVAGAIFLHAQGHATGLGSWPVDRAILLNSVAYLMWALFGIGVGALIRNQLAATVAATVLYLVGATAAGTVFDLVHTYLIDQSWVLSAQVLVPPVASAIMVSPTKLFSESPAAWVGAAVLLGWSMLAAAVGTRTLQRRDIA